MLPGNMRPYLSEACSPDQGLLLAPGMSCLAVRTHRHKRVSRAEWWLCRQSASSHKELRHAAALLKAAAGVRITGLPEEGGADLLGQAAPETAWHYPNLAFDGEQHRDALMALANSFETGKTARNLTVIPASSVLPLAGSNAQSLHACPMAGAWRL